MVSRHDMALHIVTSTSDRVVTQPLIRSIPACCESEVSQELSQQLADAGRTMGPVRTETCIADGAAASGGSCYIA